MITLPIGSDADIALILKSPEGETMALTDVLDLVITFFVVGTNKKVVRFRKTNGEGEEPITQVGDNIILRWKKEFTEDIEPCLLRSQATEIYTDENYSDNKRKTTTEDMEAIRLVANENLDAL